MNSSPDEKEKSETKSPKIMENCGASTATLKLKYCRTLSSDRKQKTERLQLKEDDDSYRSLEVLRKLYMVCRYSVFLILAFRVSLIIRRIQNNVETL